MPGNSRTVSAVAAAFPAARRKAPRQGKAGAHQGGPAAVLPEAGAEAALGPAKPALYNREEAEDRVAGELPPGCARARAVHARQAGNGFCGHDRYRCGNMGTCMFRRWWWPTIHVGRTCSWSCVTSSMPRWPASRT